MTLVCPKCFDDTGLKKRLEEIRPDYPNEKCSFHPRYKGIPLKDVAEIIDEVFRTHYGFGEFHRYADEQDGEPLTYVVADLTGATEHEIVEAVVQQLIDDENCLPQDGEEPYYDDAQYYELHTGNYEYHSRLWEEFCESIVHGQRFFNNDAKGLISEIFSGVQYQRDHRKKSPVYKINPGDSLANFFRARVANDEGKRKNISNDPEAELGPPPKRFRTAGRMNSAGIACCYAAFDLKTCISELRPVVGSVVAGAQFELTRPIYVLDTTRFDAPIKPSSVFIANHMDRVEQWAFMRKFMRSIAKPISPNDEHLDYIPTQAVAEYLLNHHELKRSGSAAKIEAIVYRSAQNPDGKNIVLLGDAAIVEPPKPKDKPVKNKKLNDPFAMNFELTSFSNLENLNPGIRIVQNSMVTVQINGAQYDSVQFSEFFYDADHDDF